MTRVEASTKKAECARRLYRIAVRGAPAIILLLGLGACGEPVRSVWTRDNTDLDQTRSDQRACVSEAQSYAFIGQNPADQSGVGANAARSQQADLYRACMAQRGYSQGPVPPKQGQNQNQNGQSSE